MSRSSKRQPAQPHLTRRQILQISAALGISTFMGGCTPQQASETGGSSAAELLKSGTSIPMETLIAEAKKEGTLSVITLPHDWANYGEILSTFKEKYGLTLNELNPNGSSAEEIEAIKANKENKGSQAPDVLDIGLGFTESGKAEGLFAPYKVATWDTIPDDLKDAEGYWYGDYYGVLAFEANLDQVTTLPEDWADLLKPEYKNMVALGGDPTQSSQAINSVWAAGLSRAGNLEDAAMAGLEFFAELNKAGNFVPVVATSGTMAKGETPIVIQWDYLALADRDTLAGNPEVAIIVPQTGILAVPYAQAISAYAPHPFAARLWEEFLYSDEGQLLWLKGYTHPVRYNDLVAKGLVPEELAAKLPPAESYEKAVFPTLKQISDSKIIITENWRKIVLGES